MATLSELAKQYADMLIEAVDRDEKRSSLTFLVREPSFGKHSGTFLANALKRLGRIFDELVYRETQEDLPEEKKQTIVNEMARRISFPRPRLLRLLIKEGGKNGLPPMSRQLAGLYKAIKDRDAKK